MLIIGGEKLDLSDLVSFAPVLIILLLVFTSSNQKKKGKGTSGQRTPNRQQASSKNTRRPNETNQKRTTSAAQTAKSSKGQRAAASAGTPQGEDPCHEYMLTPQREQMHFHSADHGEMETAGEGEDPCHVGFSFDAEEMPEQESEVSRGNPANAELRKQLTQAIIMSEVLKRPDERRAERRVRRGRKVKYG